MTEICAYCNEIIKGNLVLHCTCGGNNSFCSQECIIDWHKDRIDKIKKELK
jgi:hypothetical protein